MSDLSKEDPSARMRTGMPFRVLVESAKEGEILLDHSGSHNGRLDSTPEAVYIELWMNKNAPGRDLLAKILGRFPTQSEATVAADVVQWLGTAIGLSFIGEAEREIKRREELSRR